VSAIAKRSRSQTAKALKKLCERDDLGRMYTKCNCKIVYYFLKEAKSNEDVSRPFSV
jgi:hypothetical protein